MVQETTAIPSTSPKPDTPVCLDSRTRTLLLAIRQALILALGALEDYLEMERSIIPKHLRAR